MACHNELCDGVADLAGKDFTSTYVRDKLLIFAGCAVKRPKAKLDGSKATSATPPLDSTEQKGELLIHDLW